MCFLVQSDQHDCEIFHIQTILKQQIVLTIYSDEFYWWNSQLINHVLKPWNHLTWWTGIVNLHHQSTSHQDTHSFYSSVFWVSGARVIFALAGLIGYFKWDFANLHLHHDHLMTLSYFLMPWQYFFLFLMKSWYKVQFKFTHM